MIKVAVFALFAIIVWVGLSVSILKAPQNNDICLWGIQSMNQSIGQIAAPFEENIKSKEHYFTENGHAKFKEALRNANIEDLVKNKNGSLSVNVQNLKSSYVSDGFKEGNDYFSILFLPVDFIYNLNKKETKNSYDLMLKVKVIQNQSLEDTFKIEQWVAAPDLYKNLKETVMSSHNVNFTKCKL
ncbi:MAG: hypothetical protein ACRBCT_08915 [Alphaproteobacteria bacterium]